ncbi:CLUMA_CG009789, isoform A [Clunio marinus]|uniref:CLUMA_CG009789, isoform A n=1 Tax=Clunio marinus TaxID=568069 RepID=A0A1J1I9X5_9DIPT|nr:CLUMA_CG009789, isoform A [Clunio marinus]
MMMINGKSLNISHEKTMEENLHFPRLSDLMSCCCEISRMTKKKPPVTFFKSYLFLEIMLKN